MTKKIEKKKVIFLCTGNSARSQIAEGSLRNLGADRFEIHSAGLQAVGVHPLAVEVMKEAGIDISAQTSKTIDFRLLSSMDMVITLCGHAEAFCPVTPPGVNRLHWPITDPAGVVGTTEECLSAFRKARQEIQEKIEMYLLP